MKGNRKGLIFLVSMLLCTSILFYFVYTTSTQEHLAEMTKSLKLAAVAMDYVPIHEVNSLILNKKSPSDLLHNDSYKKLVSTLHKISDNFPIKTMWSYLVYPASEYELSTLIPADGQTSIQYSDYTILSVLTIKPDLEDPSTLPGTVFDMSKFPAMVEVIKGSSVLVISEIVYDGVYNTWNRGGFIRIYDDKGHFVGVLSVEIDIGVELNIAISAMIFALIYSVLISLFITIVLTRYNEAKIEETQKDETL
jgi:hypothetical protein